MLKLSEKSHDVVTGYYFQDGYKIHYEKVGSGEKVICMFPGAIGNARADFCPQFDLFDKDKFTMIGWDSPGFGLSRPPYRDYERHSTQQCFYEYDAQTAINLMKSLGYDNFNVMGWCDGGKSALKTAMLFPGKIEKLVIWGTIASSIKYTNDRIDRLLDFGLWRDEEILKNIRIYGSRTELEMTWYNYVKHMVLSNNIEKNELRKIKCPTFVLHGNRDVFVQRQVFDYLVENIPDIETFIFEDGAHDIHLCYPDKFNYLVQSFLCA